MEIYVKVTDPDTGVEQWLYRDEVQSYLVGSFWDRDFEYIRPTAFKTAAAARRGMREAEALMSWYGLSDRSKATMWVQGRDGRLVRVKAKPPRIGRTIKT